MRADWHHLYHTARWRALRKHQLDEHPLCYLCAELGKLKAANTVDHHIPHKGDIVLFHDPDNLRSMCKQCHDSAKATLERSGYMPGHSITGEPLDHSHHWRAQQGDTGGKAT